MGLELSRFSAKVKLVSENENLSAIKSTSGQSWKMAITPTHFCGPKCSYCCLVISVWGIIMLVLLNDFPHESSCSVFSSAARREPSLKMLQPKILMA
jgi:hypothetical protein